MSENDDSTGEARLSRRRLLLGSGTLALGGVGGFAAAELLGSLSSDAEPRFILQQGYLRWEVDPISRDGTTVREFYDYTDTSASLATDVVSEEAASRMFVYDGPVDMSLVFLHGSGDVDHGGTAKFSFSGLSRDRGEWAVRDDPMRVSDDFEMWEGGNALVKWEWGENTTDGGAFWGVLDRDDFTISVTPKTLRGVDSWRFLSGSTDDLERYDLSREKPAKLKPAKGRQVKRANVDIMPDSEDNEFDPYANADIVVAVHDPPDGVDESQWVSPGEFDPGNYAVNFGSKQYLAGQNAAQPQEYSRRDGSLYLRYNVASANFTLDSAYGYLVSKTGEKTFVRGRDVVRPGGFDNVDTEPSQLVVSDRQVDPDGDDAANLAAEYVAFQNDGDEPLDMTGYAIEDEAGQRFSMPDGFTLEPEQQFRLHTGSGQRTSTDLYWGREASVWNNDGDTIVVLDADDEPVLEYSYPRH